MNTPLRIIPEGIRTNASDLGALNEQTHQIQDTLVRAWSRLDSGWEDYAESGIQNYYNDALDELNHMIDMFKQMDQALMQTAENIEVADKSATGLFDLYPAERVGSNPLPQIPPTPPAKEPNSSREGSEEKPGAVPQPEELEPWEFTSDWPNTNIPVYLNGEIWLVNNDLRDALNDPNAPLALIEDFYRFVVVPGLIAKGAPDAAELLLRSLDSETSDYQVSERLGKELIMLPSHINTLQVEEAVVISAIKQAAETMKPGEEITFYYSSPPSVISAYNPGEYPNSTFAMADHTGWFTWQGTIKCNDDGTWVVNGTLNRDLADYSDWHGSPHDYDGDGTLECPGSQCGKTASFDLAGLNPDVWMPDMPEWLAPVDSGVQGVYDYFIPPGQDTYTLIRSLIV